MAIDDDRHNSDEDRDGERQEAHWEIWNTGGWM